MALAAPQHFSQGNHISYMGMMKRLFTVPNLHTVLSTDLSSIPWYIDTYFPFSVAFSPPLLRISY